MILIAAVSKDGIIGVNNGLPWAIPEDLKFFKEQTTGKTIVMGYNTWKSLGERPLPNRTNVVITRNPKKIARNKNVKVFTDAHVAARAYPKAFVIGGAQIYATLMPYIDVALISKVNKEVAKEKGDKTYMPPLDQELIFVDDYELTDEVTIERYERV